MIIDLHCAGGSNVRVLATFGSLLVHRGTGADKAYFVITHQQTLLRLPGLFKRAIDAKRVAAAAEPLWKWVALTESWANAARFKKDRRWTALGRKLKKLAAAEGAVL